MEKVIIFGRGRYFRKKYARTKLQDSLTML